MPSARSTGRKRIARTRRAHGGVRAHSGAAIDSGRSLAGRGRACRRRPRQDDAGRDPTRQPRRPDRGYDARSSAHRVQPARTLESLQFVLAAILELGAGSGDEIARRGAYEFTGSCRRHDASAEVQGDASRLFTARRSTSPVCTPARTSSVRASSASRIATAQRIARRRRRRSRENRLRRCRSPPREAHELQRTASLCEPRSDAHGTVEEDEVEGVSPVTWYAMFTSPLRAYRSAHSSCDLSEPIAVDRVVVDHSDGLHERVAERRPDEPESRAA